MAYLVSGFPATPEQENCINLAVAGHNQKRSLKIEAGAGSGKTSILKSIAEHLPGKGLYIAFNKAIADEAKAAFPANVDARTANSLAYREVGYRYSKRFGRLHGASVVDVLNNEPFGDYSEVQLANLALATLRQFCYSADDKILFDHVPALSKEDKMDPGMLVATREKIVLLARDIWKEMENTRSKLPVTHDFYLKKWALTSPVLNYDFIFLDEAQDSNAVLIDLVAKQQAQRIWVGDRYQSIYGWRGATNAMSTIETDDTAQITQSFRFGEAVADMANLVLARHLDTEFQIRGFSQIDSRLTIVEKPDAIICRTNQGAMRETLDLLDDGVNAVFVGDMDELITNINAVSDLRQKGYSTHINFRDFTSYKDLVDYSGTDEGLDYAVLLRMINEHGARFLVNKIYQMKNGATGSQSKGSPVVSVVTAHKSKGLEWDNVTLGEDFILPDNDRWHPEEGNLLYVAVTRAKKQLDITRLKPLLREASIALSPAEKKVGITASLRNA